MKLSELINEYGNIQKKDITCKPEFVHISGKRLQQFCRRLGIEFATCIDGFKRSGGRYNPIQDGVIIYADDLEKLQAEIEGHEKRNSPEVREKRRLARESKYQKEQKQFALEIRKRFPSAPTGEEFDIAKRACEVGSGRVGRSKIIDDPIYAAVFAHVRHKYTDYDELRDELKLEGFDSGNSRIEARTLVDRQIRNIMEEWKRRVTQEYHP